MYLRFTTTRIDEDSHKPEGVFMAAYSLLDSGDLDSIEWNRLREILDWFSKNLPAPRKEFEASRAVFWFRSSANHCIDQIWELVFMLRAHNYHVTVYKCRHLANISYYDKLQVAAYPSDFDGKITMQ